MNRGSGEERSAENVFGFARAQGVEAKRAEDVPGSHGTGVLIACKQIRSIKIVHHVPGPVSRTVLPARHRKDVQDVVRGLVAVRVLSEVDCRHLRHLMNLAAVGSGIEVGGHLDHLVEFGGDLLLAAHRLDQFRHGMGRVEAMLIRRTLDIRIAPTNRAERLQILAIRILPAEEAHTRIKNIAPVFGALHEHGVVIGLAQRPRNLRDAEVAVGSVDRLCGCLVDFVRGIIAELQIFFDAATSIACVWIAGLGRVLPQTLVGCSHIKTLDAFCGCLSEGRIDQAAGHAGAIARAWKLGQPSALLVGIHPRLQNLPKAVGEEDSHHGIPGAIDVPVTVVRVHHAGHNLPVVGTAVVHCTTSVELMPHARKQQRAIQARVKGALLLLARTFRLDALQVFIPYLLCLGAQCRDGLGAEFEMQVVLCLLEGDKRGRYTCIDRANVVRKG